MDILGCKQTQIKELDIKIAENSKALVSGNVDIVLEKTTEIQQIAREKDVLVKELPDIEVTLESKRLDFTAVSERLRVLLDSLPPLKKPFSRTPTSKYRCCGYSDTQCIVMILSVSYIHI